MKFYKKVTAVLVSAAVALSLGGCTTRENNVKSSGPTEITKDGDSSQPVPNPSGSDSALTGVPNVTSDNEYILAAFDKVQNAISYQGVLKNSVEMTIGDSTSKTNVETNTTMHSDTMTLKVDRTIEADGVKTQSAMYILPGEDGVYVYAEGEDGWSKQKLDENGLFFVVLSYDYCGFASVILSKIDQCTEGEKETLDGKNVIRIDGVLPAGSLPTVASYTRAFDLVGLSDLPETYYEGVEDTPISVWIDEETGYLVKYSIDYAKALTKASANLIKETSPESEENAPSFAVYSAEVILSNFEQAPMVNLPAEAENAKLYEPPTEEENSSAQE